MILEAFKLDEKKALVTGCKRGIGKAIALAEAVADIIGVSASLELEGSEVENQKTLKARPFIWRVKRPII